MNERYDIANDPAFDLGADALHVRSADEILMEREDAAALAAADEVRMAPARCMMSLILVITQAVRDVREIRDRLAVVASFKCADLLAETMWKGRREWQKAAAAMASCGRLEWEDASGRLMVEMLIAGGWSEREVGKRALCLVYAFVPDESVRPMLARSFATIGKAIGLTAENKRSAVSAAMKSLVLEMVHRAQRIAGRRGTGEFWFMKREHCRAALSKAMKGKRNRLAKRGMANDEGRMRNEGRAA